MWLSDGRPAAAVDVRVAATGEIIAGGKREVRIEVLRHMAERGPTFRGENSNTSRHLAEFWMIEPEIAFADLSDNAALAEALLKYTFVALLNEREQDLAFFDQRIEKGLLAKLEGIVGSEFVHMDYGEAIQVLERCEREIQVPGQMGRRPAVGARALSDREIREEAGPRGELPEGHQSLLHAGNDDGRTVAAMDVLAPGMGEIIGGSQREERLEVLDRNMAERGIDKEAYAGYCDLRRTATASPMSATPSPSRAPAAPPSIDIHIADFGILGG